MNPKYNVLILGASYGSLFGTKLLLAGHPVTLVCTQGTADLINSQGTTVRMPIRGRDKPAIIESKDTGTRLTAATPEEVNPGDYDLVVLAMQEPQYGSAGVRDLMGRIASARVPCLAIMNMPPLPYLARIPDLKTEPLEQCFADPGAWDGFDPSLVTLASPDPQAFRPPEEPKNVLQVSLPTNFKAARFDDDAHTAMLRHMQEDIEAVRFDADGESVELPVKLKVHDSIFVPLAKWSMLLTGNYRCIRRDEMIPICDAVHADLEASRAIYEWVSSLSMQMGAEPGDLVPFDKYAAAAKGLAKPSSAARALFGGAKNIERVDCIVKQIAKQQGMHSKIVDEINDLVNDRLAKNRAGS